MAAPKRTGLQRERDFEEMARLYIQRWTQQEIAEKLGLTRQQISYDLKKLQERWYKSSVEAIDIRKAEELARIDRLERTYWDAWEKSVGEATITTQTVEDGRTPKRKAIKRIEELNGDPRFLAGVQWCIEMRAKIIGIKAPEKHEIAGRDGGPIKTFTTIDLGNLSVDELHLYRSLVERSQVQSEVDDEE